jgi:hypothetical protein
MIYGIDDLRKSGQLLERVHLASMRGTSNFAGQRKLCQPLYKAFLTQTRTRYGFSGLLNTKASLTTSQERVPGFPRARPADLRLYFLV